MRKKIPSQIRKLMESCFKFKHRGIIVILGDRAKDQVINLNNLWLSIRNQQETSNQQRKILWCYKNELGFSSHQKKRQKEISKQMKQGLYEAETDDPFQLFLQTSDIRYCYYKDSQQILGNTFDILILQDFESITANILCRTIETIQGGGLVFFMLKTMTSLKHLYSLVMDVHNKYRTDAFNNIEPIFNERLTLSLIKSENTLFVDDELNFLQITKQSQNQSQQNEQQQEDQNTNNQNFQQLKTNDQTQLINLIESLSQNKLVQNIIKITKTLDQAKVVLFLIDSLLNRQKVNKQVDLNALTNQQIKQEVVFIQASRGRGKSASLGLAISGALAYNIGEIFITATTPENLKIVFEFIGIGLESNGFKKNMDFNIIYDQDKLPRKIIFIQTQKLNEHLVNQVSDQTVNVQEQLYKINRQQVSYISPSQQTINCSLLVIDEASAIPITLVKPLVMQSNCLVFISSTINGYEGTGRSLSLKLIEELRRQGINQPGKYLKEIQMNIPIRYGVNDPIEKWLSDFLCLDQTQAVPLQNSLPHPNNCQLYFVKKSTLFSYNKSSEIFLRQIWSLFISSHYKNSPNDLQLLADAPGHFLCALLGPLNINDSKSSIPDVLVAIQLCLEGNLSQSTIEQNQGRGLRPSGDLVPWTLSEQLLDTSLLNILGVRIVRIATHPQANRLGYGTQALNLLQQFFKKELKSENELMPMEEFARNISYEVQDQQNDQQLLPKRQLPPLLKLSNDIQPFQVEYLSVSYGLTKELFRFWNKNGFQSVYIKHSKNETTGENTMIMIKPIKAENLNYAFIYEQFRKRFLQLLNQVFNSVDIFICLEIIKPQLSLNLESDENNQMENNETKIKNQIEIRQAFDEFDLKRLEAYSRNCMEYYQIQDLIPKLALLYFQNKFQGIVGLSFSQAAVLLGFGLQSRTLEDLGNIIRIEHSQILALYNKIIKKFTNGIKECIQQEIEKQEQLNNTNKQKREFNPLKIDSQEIIGGLVKKKHNQGNQNKAMKRIKK